MTDLRHVSLYVTAACRNVLVGAKFRETQWNDTLISWSFIRVATELTV